MPLGSGPWKAAKARLQRFPVPGASLCHSAAPYVLALLSLPSSHSARCSLSFCSFSFCVLLLVLCPCPCPCPPSSVLLVPLLRRARRARCLRAPLSSAILRRQTAAERRQNDRQSRRRRPRAPPPSHEREKTTERERDRENRAGSRGRSEKRARSDGGRKRAREKRSTVICLLFFPLGV